MISSTRFHRWELFDASTKPVKMSSINILVGRLEPEKFTYYNIIHELQREISELQTSKEFPKGSGITISEDIAKDSSFFPGCLYKIWTKNVCV